MVILKENDKKSNWCRFDEKVKCFVIGDCIENNLTDCLKANLYLVYKELNKLKETKHMKHTTISLKWRDQAFYYKKRVKLLSLWIKAKGMQVPTIEEIQAIFPVEVEDESTICSDSEEGTLESRRDNNNPDSREQSNPEGRPDIQP